MSISISDKDWFTKLCYYLHTNDILSNDKKSISEMSRIEIGNVPFFHCISKLPDNWKPGLNFSLGKHTWERIWNKKMHENMLENIIDTISKYNEDDIKNCINGNKHVDFIKLFQKGIENSDVYDDINTGFKCKNFESFCEHALKLNNEETKKMYGNLKSFYIDSIPLILMSNIGNFIIN